MAKEVNKEVFEVLPVPQAVAKFVVPSLASTLITIIYSLADTLFVGMLNNPSQLAGLTVAFPYYQFLNAFSSLWGVGTNSVMSRALGEKDYDRVSKASSHGFWGSLVFMAVVCVIFQILEKPLLYVAGASAQSYDSASVYMLIVFVIGGIPTVLSIVMSNLLRAEGHAKSASSGLMLGGLLNCILDPIFIFGADMGVAGAAVATLISNCVSLIFLIVVYIRIRETSYITLKPFPGGVSWKLIKDVILVGLPSGCLTVLGATGCIIQTSLYSLYGDAAVAGWGVVNRISFISIYTVHGVAQGVLPLIGYNYGAKNFKRVRSVNKCAFLITEVLAWAIMILSLIFSAGIIKIFINDVATIEAGVQIMRKYMLCTPFMAIVLLVSTLCQAVGKWQYSLIMLAIRQLVFNIPITFLLNSLFAMKGVASGQPTTELICFIGALFVYHRCFYRAMNREELLSKK